MVHLKRTLKPVSGKNIERKWHLIDLNGKVLGRITNEIATILQGKHKTHYVPHIDVGDYVVVINASKVAVTGSKEDKKEYSYYSGYPGGQRNVTLKRLRREKPSEIIHHAVSGMLPKNKLRDRRLARLHIYADEKHPYQIKFIK